MNTTEMTTGGLVLVPPIGAVLNEEIIIDKAKEVTGIDGLQIVNLECRTGDTLKHDTLVVWVHKDASRFLPSEVRAVIEQHSSVTILCTCPECKTLVQRNLRIFDMPPFFKAHWCCENCDEMSMS